MAALDSTDRPESSPVTAAFLGKIAGAATIAVSSIAGIILVELVCYLFFPSIRAADIQQWNRRIMFFDGAGTIVQNHGRFFTYVPHNDVRSLTVYFSDDGFNVEYDYRFHTNNHGLVQDADIVAARPSLLLLGDSFTEGQGAEPWFRQLPTPGGSRDYQLINGGLMGTGFAQWSLLEQYLSAEDVNIRKVLVLFISDDFLRHVWNFSPTVLGCLQSLSTCRGGEGLYYRLPPDSEMPKWVDTISMALTSRIGRGVRRFLPASYRVFEYLNIKSRELVFSGNSRAAIADLIRKYGAENVVFMHLPEKDEVAGPSPLGLQARQAINDAGGNLVDGFKLCRLNASDYYIRDGHPNTQGYGKIADCVREVMLGMTTAAQ